MQVRMLMLSLYSRESRWNWKGRKLMAAGTCHATLKTCPDKPFSLHIVLVASSVVPCTSICIPTWLLSLCTYCGRQHSVAEQVDMLLRQATGIDSLSNMYEGWTPWVWGTPKRVPCALLKMHPQLIQWKSDEINLQLKPVLLLHSGVSRIVELASDFSELVDSCVPKFGEKHLISAGSKDGLWIKKLTWFLLDSKRSCINVQSSLVVHDETP